MRSRRALSRAVPPGAGAGSTALFPGGSSDDYKHGNSLREQIAEAVFAHTGLRAHPHLFRL
jgi:hypothetical protein